MPRSERRSVRAVQPVTAAALSVLLGVSAAAAPRPPSPGADGHTHTHTHTRRRAEAPSPLLPAPRGGKQPCRYCPGRCPRCGSIASASPSPCTSCCAASAPAGPPRQFLHLPQAAALGPCIPLCCWTRVALCFSCWTDSGNLVSAPCIASDSGVSFDLFVPQVPASFFPTQNGNVAIVTGGAKGIGYHTVKHLARLGMHVILAGNDESEGQEAVRKIKEETVNGKVEFLHCDLASMKSIRQFVQQFRAKNCPLHVLVNNAGVMLVPERKTEDGFEEHFGLNYLGHFLLTNLLLETLKQSGTRSRNARVITVSSATHYVGRLHLNDLQSRCSYSPHGAYAQSKLALVLFTYRLQHLMTADGSHVTANVVDPGVVNTELYKNVCWATKVVKWMTAWLFFKVPATFSSSPPRRSSALCSYSPWPA
ncbi:dehydrogenase/reductase SDR family member on chromosome X isoform X4 [Gopherus evgoodei]|uniref:dehydrogenase/reductase SDR family member on chromosome X isoform X4 n=1 Tax=Gopherus evgoodei TaxID=1825980 RepID=UPI0011CEE644|nr:dehydrogenase/reductase SDR family member on chromosome X isoform X4 [Gopherus evgoodei]